MREKGNENDTPAMSTIKILCEHDRRQSNTIIILICAWVFTTTVITSGFLLYLNQYEYVSETYEADSEDNGTAIINGGEGDVTVGKSEKSDKEEGKKEIK